MPLDINPEIELLDHMVVIVLVLLVVRIFHILLDLFIYLLLEKVQVFQHRLAFKEFLKDYVFKRQRARLSEESE